MFVAFAAAAVVVVVVVVAAAAAAVLPALSLDGRCAAWP